MTNAHHCEIAPKLVRLQNTIVIGEKILDAIRHYKLMAPGDRILIAVSGGVDSVVLLRTLFELQDAA